MKRITISVTDEIRTGMETANRNSRTRINWSNIASRAFENEINKHKRIENMNIQQIAERIKPQFQQSQQLLGEECGEQWAASSATAEQLMWLKRQDVQDSDGFTEWFMTCRLKGISFECGDIDGFWKGEGVKGRRNAHWMKGFAIGALRVWSEVSPEIMD